MLILDLDDTIFQTSTMNPDIFDSALQVIYQHYYDHNVYSVDKIVKDLWNKPIDTVFAFYNTPSEIAAAFYDEIAAINYKKLKIMPFSDYTEIQRIDQAKILVTTGLKELQNAKIDALGIRGDFIEVYIDDPRAQPRNTKNHIFKTILSRTQKQPQDVWVIGDNPDSEIEAAHNLDMKTIQRASSSKGKSEKADFYVETFKGINEIVN